jgi:hypothetical protein
MNDIAIPVTDFEIPSDVLTGLNAPPNLKFEREDFSLFRTVEGLEQKAGVPKGKLARLVLKELADNGLDEGADIEIGELPRGGWFEDDGPGIDGPPEEIARLFSIARPMLSSKLLRRPTRGAVGNGLRVVAGAVLASRGSLVVTTRNRRITLRPERDGTTTVIAAELVDFPVGTRVEVNFGPAIPRDKDAACWAKLARTLARYGQLYSGKASPHFYDHMQTTATGSFPVPRQTIPPLAHLLAELVDSAPIEPRLEALLAPLGPFIRQHGGDRLSLRIVSGRRQ